MHAGSSQNLELEADSSAQNGAVAGALHLGLLERFQQVRRATEDLCAPLQPEDQMVQSCPEASPVKWHLAHTSWFFEVFILREFLAGYRQFHPDFGWLFNSYYRTLGDHPEKKLRASFSRPAHSEIMAYREHVDAEIAQLLQSCTTLPQEALNRIEMGLHHEQQHQELIATDIKHALWTNPLRPTYAGPLGRAGVLHADHSPAARKWFEHPGGLADIGYSGDAFAFDNEAPRHTVYLQPFEIASRPISCAEYLAFMQDDGYRRPELWLSEGWDTMRAHGWEAPVYWYRDDSRNGDWSIYTLRGSQPLSELADTPVCHVSYFEADAFAHWHALRHPGSRLPTEAEWEAAAEPLPVRGNLAESHTLHPQAQRTDADAGSPGQMFGDVWEWTQSAYLGYPGYTAPTGALGEYNGKFMSSQMVLRGGSCVTPATHIRATYRNFFPPATRWQFSGIRLAQLAHRGPERG